MMRARRIVFLKIAHYSLLLAAVGVSGQGVIVLNEKDVIQEFVHVVFAQIFFFCSYAHCLIVLVMLVTSTHPAVTSRRRIARGWGKAVLVPGITILSFFILLFLSLDADYVPDTTQRSSNFAGLLQWCICASLFSFFATYVLDIWHTINFGSGDDDDGAPHHRQSPAQSPSENLSSGVEQTSELRSFGEI